MAEAGTGTIENARLEQAMARLRAAVERLEATTQNPPAAVSDSLRQEIAEIEAMLGKAIALLTPQKGTHSDEG